MRVRSFHGFGELDVQATVTQMDQITWELRSAWQRADSQWTFMFTTEQAQSADARLKAIKGLIDLLDVGGEGRQHVFFPLPGQTQQEAWDAYKNAAESARQSLAELGQFVSKWSLTNTLPRIGSDVKDELKTDLTWVVVGLGAIVGLQLLSAVGSAKRAFSGYARRRRR